MKVRLILPALFYVFSAFPYILTFYIFDRALEKILTFHAQFDNVNFYIFCLKLIELALSFTQSSTFAI